jgi:5'-methylthioadenosine phosphorylase
LIELMDKACEIGIIGGSGVYDPAVLEGVEEIKAYTPFGAPSDLILVGSLHGRRVAFIPRHGRRHQLPPHRVPYRANIWALKELGVTRVIATSAVGSLREDYRPSEFVVVDQFIDRTKWREDTFYEGGRVCHVSTADPFCPELRETFIVSARRMGIPIHDRGTYICIQGPRFSTRAESRLFRSWGVDVIGMTLYPEVALAREVELCYISVAMVTDYDVWAERPVSADEILKTMVSNVENFRRLIINTIPKIPVERKCGCGSALRSAMV